MATVKVDDLTKAVVAALENYCQDATDMLKDEVKAVGKECRKELKDTSPKRTGEYAKSWRFKVVFENHEDIRVRVYNAKHYQLTHLLEYGHALRNGGRARAFPHIKPAEENAINKLLNKVKVGLK